MKVKIPFNWAGNKTRYMDYVNTLIIGKNYNRVIDLFMGSGNLLANIRCNANIFIGNDIIKLMPSILQHMSENVINFKYEDVKALDDKWKFDRHEQYFVYRDYWNSKYLADVTDKDFIIETVMLLKMCSNSLVRFNRTGAFNQGFRGISRHKVKSLNPKFFNDTTLKNIAKELNILNEALTRKKFKFYNMDYVDLIEDLFSGGDFEHYNKSIHTNTDTYKDLILIDPPYLLSNTSTYGGTYDDNKEDYLLNLIHEMTEKVDFILFNYMNNCGKEHSKLREIVDNNKLKMVSLSNRGKLKSVGGDGSNKINEVLITNITREF